MKKRFMLVWLCLIMGIVPSAAQYYLAGTVTETGSGSLLAGVTVSLNGLYSTVTDTAGRFVIDTDTSTYIRLPAAPEPSWSRLTVTGRDIFLSLKKACPAVTITLHDARGRSRTLLHRSGVSKGMLFASWPAVVSGVYFLEVRLGDTRFSRRCVYMEPLGVVDTRNPRTASSGPMYFAKSAAGSDTLRFAKRTYISTMSLTGTVDSSITVELDRAAIGQVTVDSTGDSVFSADGVAGISIPPGALDSGRIVTVTLEKDTAAAADSLGPVYRAGPSGTSFDQWVTFSLAYDPDSLGSVLPESLWLWGMETGDTALRPLQYVTVDTARHLILCLKKHFSTVRRGVRPDGTHLTAIWVDPVSGDDNNSGASEAQALKELAVPAYRLARDYATPVQGVWVCYDQLTAVHLMAGTHIVPDDPAGVELTCSLLGAGKGTTFLQARRLYTRNKAYYVTMKDLAYTGLLDVHGSTKLTLENCDITGALTSHGAEATRGGTEINECDFTFSNQSDSRLTSVIEVGNGDFKIVSSNVKGDGGTMTASYGIRLMGSAREPGSGNVYISTNTITGAGTGLSVEFTGKYPAIIGARIIENTISGNGTGISVSPGSDYPMSSFHGNLVQQNTDGVIIAEQTTSGYSTWTGNRIIKNDQSGVRVTTTSSTADFGGGPVSSSGGNEFSCNGTVDFYTAGPVNAQQCKWDNDPPKTAADGGNDLEGPADVTGSSVVDEPCLPPEDTWDTGEKPHFLWVANNCIIDGSCDALVKMCADGGFCFDDGTPACGGTDAPAQCSDDWTVGVTAENTVWFHDLATGDNYLQYGGGYMSTQGYVSALALAYGHLTVMECGPNGCTYSEYDRTYRQFGMTVSLYGAGHTTDLAVVPDTGRNDDNKLLRVDFEYNTVYWYRMDSSSGSWSKQYPTLLGASLTDASGSIVSAIARNPMGAILAGTDGAPGELWYIEAGQTPEKIAAVGDSVRRVRVADSLVFVTCFGSDSVWVFTWQTDSLAPVPAGAFAVGDGPVGIDIRKNSDGTYSVLTTGMHDNTYTITLVSGDGQVVSSSTTALTTVQGPAFGVFLRDGTGRIAVSGNSSGNYTVQSPE